VNVSSAAASINQSINRVISKKKKKKERKRKKKEKEKEKEKKSPLLLLSFIN